MKILKTTTAYIKRINSESPDYLANMLKLNSCVNSTTDSRAIRYSNLNFLCPANISETLKDTFAVKTI